mmetsp:Transcript_5613/g.14337  ORF Transcript_5613/g.14337 Transcript_5613/m.14337 type:complete len:207 (+) Transcript_5613:909-1529(+)
MQPIRGAEHEYVPEKRPKVMPDMAGVSPMLSRCTARIPLKTPNTPMASASPMKATRSPEVIVPFMRMSAEGPSSFSPSSSCVAPPCMCSATIASGTIRKTSAETMMNGRRKPPSANRIDPTTGAEVKARPMAISFTPITIAREDAKASATIAKMARLAIDAPMPWITRPARNIDTTGTHSSCPSTGAYAKSSVANVCMMSPILSTA